MILVDNQIRQLSLSGTDVKGLPGIDVIPWWNRPMDGKYQGQMRVTPAVVR